LEGRKNEHLCHTVGRNRGRAAHFPNFTRITHKIWGKAHYVCQQCQRWSELFSTAGIRNSGLRELIAATDMAICWLSDPKHLVESNLRQAGVKKIIVAPVRPPENSYEHVAEIAHTIVHLPHLS